jgi:hypothetical protein
MTIRYEIDLIILVTQVSSMSKSSKDKGWNAIFDKHDIHSHDFNKSPYYINSKEIKIAVQHLTTTSAKEVRILCYQASRKDRPQVFVDRGIFILPIKNGSYVLVKGEGYIDIPEIKTPAIEFKPSIDFQLLAPSVGNSESQYLDYAVATGLLEHFTNEDKLFLTIRGRKRTPGGFFYNVNGFRLKLGSVQTEVDGGYEGKSDIYLTEAKNAKQKDVIIRQLYFPYRYWSSIIPSKKIHPVFFEKHGHEYRFWLYEITDKNDYNSIRLVKSSKYVLS